MPEKNRKDSKTAANLGRYPGHIYQVLVGTASYLASLGHSYSDSFKMMGKALESLSSLTLFIASGVYALRAFSGKTEHAPRRLAIAAVGIALVAIVASNPASALLATSLYGGLVLGESIWRTVQLSRRLNYARQLSEEFKKQEGLSSMPKNAVESTASKSLLARTQAFFGLQTPKTFAELKEAAAFPPEAELTQTNINKHISYCNHKMISKGVQSLLLTSLGAGLVLSAVFPPVGIPLTVISAGAYLGNMGYKKWNEKNRLGEKSLTENDFSRIGQWVNRGFDFLFNKTNETPYAPLLDTQKEKKEVVKEVRREIKETGEIKETESSLTTAKQRLFSRTNSDSSLMLNLNRTARPVLERQQSSPSLTTLQTSAADLYTPKQEMTRVVSGRTHSLKQSDPEEEQDLSDNLKKTL